MPQEPPAVPTTTTAAPGWLVRSAGIGGRLLVLAVAAWVLGILADKLTLVLVTVLVALLIAGVFAPVAAWFRRRRGPDWVGPLVIVLVLLAVIGGALLGLGARIAGQLPQLRSQLSDAAADLSRRLGVELSLGVGGGSQQGSGGSQQGGGSLSAADPLTLARSALEVLVGLFLVLALAFLFLKDGDRMWRWGLGKVSPRRRDEVDEAGRAAWQTVGTYVRGLTIVALFDAVGIGLGLLVIGVPMVLTLAALQFLASYVPTIGAFVAGAVAVAVAYVNGGLVTAALTLALVIVVQQIGNDVIEPWVMGRTLGLHPAVILIAVTAGAVLWGIAGALLFVPLTAAVTAAAHVLWVRRHPPAAAPG